VRTALVHDWLITHRGGERVLEAIAELLPNCEIFTLLHKPGAFPDTLEQRPIHTSFLQRIPGALEHHRQLLPLFPQAIESFDLRGFDRVVSSSHCVAKGVRVPEGAKHLSYVHAPMRYMWDLFDDYFGPGRASVPVRAAAHALRPWLQRWDRRTASRVDRFVANSHNVARKITRFYGREAQVIPPPVDLERFARLPLEGSGQGGYFLWVGAFAPYKRLDLVLEAFGALGLPLWVAGSGQDAARLPSVPSNVRLLGQVSDAALPALYRDCRALIFPGEEDFGITPVEAQAAGRPLIAFGRGGALETVTSETGLFFEEQTAEAIVQTVRRFETWEKTFDPRQARANAGRFTKARFQADLAEALAQL